MAIIIDIVGQERDRFESIGGSLEIFEGFVEGNITKIPDYRSQIPVNSKISKFQNSKDRYRFFEVLIF